MRDNLTLRELIEMIIKRKKMICIITAIAVIISGVYSFFIVEPLYSATSILLTNPIERNKSDIPEGISGIMDSLVEYPSMTIDTYKEQVINNTVLTNTINKLNLLNSKGNAMQWSELASKISVDIVNKTNLLRITVTEKNPEKSAEIANTVSEKFIEYISNNARRFGEQATSIIEDQLKAEEYKMEEQSKKIQEYLANSQNVEQLKMEVQSLYSKIDTYNMDLVNVEKQIITDREALKVLLKDKNTITGIDIDTAFKVNIPLNNNDSYQNIEMNIDSNSELQKALVTIKATELETRLIQNQAEKNSIQSQLEGLNSRLKNTQTILAEEEYKYNAIRRNYNLAEQTYNAYLDRHKEALLAATSNIGESTIIISSPATIPLNPSSRGKVFYLAVGTASGFILGVVIALVLAYWKETEPRDDK